MSKNFSVKKLGVAIVAMLITGSLAGCNRVPGSRVKLERHASRSVNAIEIAVVEAYQAGEQGRDVATAEDMELCVRACGHWVGLRFQSPDGMQRLNPDERNTVNELLEQQRALNRADCEEACARSRNGHRSRCILQSMTVEETVACAH